MDTIIITPAQAAAVAAWIVTGPDMAHVTLTAGDSGKLYASQGDDGTVFAADGSQLADDETGD